MPADALATSEGSASAGIVLTSKTGVFQSPLSSIKRVKIWKCGPGTRSLFLFTVILDRLMKVGSSLHSNPQFSYLPTVQYICYKIVLIFHTWWQKSQYIFWYQETESLMPKDISYKLGKTCMTPGAHFNSDLFILSIHIWWRIHFTLISFQEVGLLHNFVAYSFF